MQSGAGDQKKIIIVIKITCVLSMTAAPIKRTRLHIVESITCRTKVTLLFVAI